MLKFIFRIALFGLGLFVCYVFGGSALKTIGYRFTGESVQGKVIGFMNARRGTTVFQEGVSNTGKRRARRPVFQYPVAAGSTDSLTVKSSTGVFFSFTQYDLNEKVTVVFSKNDPQDAYLFGFQVLLMQLLVLLLGLYMLKIGITGKL
jgi:Protein of unknown function (DUF3592)